MTVLDRSELQASPLSDLHLIADQMGLEGFRRLRKADLIDAILGEEGSDSDSDSDDAPPAEGSTERRTPARRSRATRSRRGGASAKLPTDAKPAEQDEQAPAPERAPAARRGRGRATREAEQPEQGAEGIVEVLGNGSAFARIDRAERREGVDDRVEIQVVGV